MRKITALLFFILNFVLLPVTLGAQITVEEPKVPEGYQEWPNSFQSKIRVQDEQTFDYRLYARKEARTGVVEYVELLKVNEEELVRVNYYHSVRHPHKVTYLYADEEWVEIKDFNTLDAEEALESWEEYLIGHFHLQEVKAIGALTLLSTVVRKDRDEFLEHILESEWPSQPR